MNQPQREKQSAMFKRAHKIARLIVNHSTEKVAYKDAFKVALKMASDEAKKVDQWPSDLVCPVVEWDDTEATQADTEEGGFDPEKIIPYVFGACFLILFFCVILPTAAIVYQ